MNAPWPNNPTQTQVQTHQPHETPPGMELVPMKIRILAIVLGALLESIPPCTTPGKWLLGLHAADTHGAPCSPVRAVARNGCNHRFG